MHNIPECNRFKRGNTMFYREHSPFQLLSEIDDWSKVTAVVVATIVAWAITGLAFILTGTALFESVLGGFLLLAIVLAGGWRTLVMSLLIVTMFKVGGETLISFMRPWGVTTVAEELLGIIKATSFAQMTLGIYTILFFIIGLPKYIFDSWHGR